RGGLVARVADWVLCEERTSTAGSVVGVYAEERDLPTVAGGGRGEEAEFSSARSAPRRPGVQHDGKTAQRVEPVHQLWSGAEQLARLPMDRRQRARRTGQCSLHRGATRRRARGC